MLQSYECTSPWVLGGYCLIGNIFGLVHRIIYNYAVTDVDIVFYKIDISWILLGMHVNVILDNFIRQKVENLRLI